LNGGATSRVAVQFQLITPLQNQNMKLAVDKDVPIKSKRTVLLNLSADGGVRTVRLENTLYVPDLKITYARFLHTSQ